MMQLDSFLVMINRYLSTTILLLSIAYCSVASAVEIVLQFDDFARPETQANVLAGIDGFYDPEFNGFDVMIPLNGVDSTGTAGTLLVAQVSGFGDNGVTGAKVRTHNEGAGVSNSNGTGVNGGDTIEITFDQPVIMRSYSLAFTTAETNVFYRVGGQPQVDFTVPELFSSQLIDIPNSILPAGEPFVIGSNDFQFLLSQAVIEFAGAVSAPTVIDVPPDPAPTSVGANTQLNLFAGGVIGNDFDALEGSEVNITGGAVGERFTSFSGSTVNISGGSIDSIFGAAGTVNISGGSFGCCFNAFGVVTVSGGSFTNAFQAFNGSVVNISGGSIGRDFRALGGSQVNISGGSMGDNFDTSPPSNLDFFGGNYLLDGVPIGGLNSLGDTLAFNLPDGSVLSGTFADGTPFAFSSVDQDTIRDGTLTLKVASLPPFVPGMILLPIDPIPRGLRNGQTLVIDNRRAFVGNDFNAELGSTVVMKIGRIGNNFEAVGSQITISGGVVGHSFDAFHGSTVNISGGSVGIGFDAFDGSQVNIFGGTIGDSFRAFNGSEVNISGGSVGIKFQAFEGSEVNISGGVVGERFDAFEGSNVNISGGIVGDSFRAFDTSVVNISGGSVGDGFQALFGSKINLIGTQFVLDGIDITDLLTINVPLTISDRDVALTGHLVDGSQVRFALDSQFASGEDFFAPGAILTVTLVPEPASALLSLIPITVGIGLGRWWNA